MSAARLAVAALALAACTPDNGPTMRPGDDCLRCHGTNPAGSAGDTRRATRWSVAGTVYATTDSTAVDGIEGVDVEVTDSAGFSFTLHSNLVGNFYSAETVAFPATVCVSRGGARRCMEEPSPHGACNGCHTTAPGGAGRIAPP